MLGTSYHPMLLFFINFYVCGDAVDFVVLFHQNCSKISITGLFFIWLNISKI
jgi:hypothetical protein